VIVVSTPTGLIGHQVLEDLLERDEPVRVIVRDPNSLTAGVRERVEVVKGSLDDHDVVDQAFDGADSVFWLVPPDPNAASVDAAYVDFSRPASEALASHGVKRVVIISALGRGVPLQETGYVAASLAMEDLIASSGANLRVLTMPSFMDNLMWQVVSIKSQGVFYSPISGDRKLPITATRDTAAIAADLLLDHSWSGQKSVPVLGAEDLSFNEVAHIMSEVLERPVRFQQISGKAYKANFTKTGMSDAMAQGLLDMAIAKDHGLDNAVVRTPESTTPTTFRQWCEEVLKPAVFASSV
jgi:uncharacterized protein YbjT (DUF2867 family)